MSTATELMRRALDYIDRNYDRGLQLHKEIEVFLSNPSDDAEEPVFIRPDHLALARKSPFLCQVGPVQVADFIPLYTRPEPARKPMTEDAEDEAFNIASKYAAWLETENRMLREARKPITKREMLTWYDELRPKSVADFVLGVRFAEKHHGIGEDDE